MCTPQLDIQLSFAFCGLYFTVLQICHTKNKIHRLDPSLYRRIETVQQLEQAKAIVLDFQDVQGVEGAE